MEISLKQPCPKCGAEIDAYRTGVTVTPGGPPVVSVVLVHDQGTPKRRECVVREGDMEPRRATTATTWIHGTEGPELLTDADLDAIAEDAEEFASKGHDAQFSIEFYDAPRRLVAEVRRLRKVDAWATRDGIKRGTCRYSCGAVAGLSDHADGCPESE